jgi:hypothetical protein
MENPAAGNKAPRFFEFRLAILKGILAVSGAVWAETQWAETQQTKQQNPPETGVFK